MLNTKRTALVTGASTGIGHELAKLIAADGYDLVLVARDREKLIRVAGELKEGYGIRVKPMAKDLSKPLTTTEIFIELEEEGIKVDLLVNNAGFGTYGLFNDSHFTTELEMISVNLVSLTHLTKLFLDHMVKQGHGKILNVASTAAFQPGPLMSVYYATKAYVLSFSEALAEELRGTGVSVTVLCPGPTSSSFQERANLGKTRLIRWVRAMTAKKVAKAGYEGLRKNKKVVVPGLLNKILVQALRLAPRKLVARTVKMIHEQV